MEFHELKKIWDAQNNELLYGFNERTLHYLIREKGQKGKRITYISEVLSVLANIGGGCIILLVSLAKGSGNVFMYLLSGWMICTALYVLIMRLRRMKQDRSFDRTIRGDLEYSLAVTTYQVQFSRLMRWNILPITILILGGMWLGEKSVWVMAAVGLFFAIGAYASGFEHRYYTARKRELEVLKDKLEND